MLFVFLAFLIAGYVCATQDALLCRPRPAKLQGVCLPKRASSLAPEQATTSLRSPLHCTFSKIQRYFPGSLLRLDDCASVAISKTPPDLVLKLLVSTTPASCIGDQMLTCLRLCVVIAHQFPRAGGFSPSLQLRNRYGVSRLTLTRKRGFS